jgi:signal transduction histidine kinase
LIQKAEIQQFYNDYNGSEINATEALRFLKHTQWKQYPVKAYTILGTAYMNMLDAKEALACYDMASVYATDGAALKMIANNKACVYMSRNEYGKAISLLSGLLKTETVQKDTFGLKTKILHNLGYSRFKKDGGGKKEMEEALKNCLISDNAENLASGYLHLSEYYYSRNRAAAIAFAQKSFAAAAAFHSIDDKLLALKQLVFISPANKSAGYSKKYMLLNDSIGMVRRMAKNMFALRKYDNTEIRKAKERSQLDNQLKAAELRWSRLLNWGGFLMVIIICIFFYYKNKKEKQLASYKTETRIAKKIHDEIANDIYHTMAFAEIQDLAAPDNKETLIHNLDNIYSRTRDISRENNTIDTGPGFPDRLRELMSGYQSTHVNILVAGLGTISWNAVASDKKIVIYRTIQELLTNMRKHSHCNRAVFAFKTIKNKITVEYKDDGRGAGKIIFRNGMLNMENRIKAARGKLIFEPSAKGFKASFTLPY